MLSHVVHSAKWQKRREYMIQSLFLLKPVGRHVKAKLRQQNSCWYIVLQEDSELDLQLNSVCSYKVCGHRAVALDL